MLFFHELPFHDTPVGPDPADAFFGGYVRTKYPLDGILRFRSVRFASSNAKSFARYFQLAFGFQEVAQRGLETGSKCLASHVVQSGNVFLEFMDTLEPKLVDAASPGLAAKAQRCLHHHAAASALQYASFRKILEKLSDLEIVSVSADYSVASTVDCFVARHGFGVFDVVLDVTSAKLAYDRATMHGATPIQPPTVCEDENGAVVVAVVGAKGSDLCHTLVETVSYRGTYLPHYKAPRTATALTNSLAFVEIDHCVQNYSWNEMMDAASFYAHAFGFQQFWSVDDKDVSTGNTGLRSIVMASANGMVKMPINEPAKSKMKGQIEEFYEYYNGPGIQHVALRTTNIVGAVKALRARGLEFNSISDAYYENLMERLQKHDIVLNEDLDVLKENHILVDFDPASRYRRKTGSYECHYILQIFTTPFHDRPTFFLELIQRYHHNGFGKGTFKGLFESIELQQKIRGTLVPAE